MRESNTSTLVDRGVDLIETAASLGLPLLHARTAVLGGPTARPLYDTLWLHQKSRTP